MVYFWTLPQALCVAFLAFASSSLATPVKPHTASAPTVQVRNGTLSGLYSHEYDQDFYLGVPYSQPPVGDLRFRSAEPLNTTWKGTKSATEYSPQCYGYGSDTWILGNNVSEDCLTLNVIRPSGNTTGLPVAIWIHGGGFTNGGSSDPRYNLSFIVQQATHAKTPFIAVSINYRLHAWGFLYGKEVLDAGIANLGFKDQRLAMRWVQENIEAFGGDPTKVTLWGESAGSRSIASHLIAYGGRDDKLFRAAIMESGSARNKYSTVESWQGGYDNITQAANCSTTTDTLDCLRHVPAEKLSSIFNSTMTSALTFGPSFDSDFIQQPGLDQLSEGKFVKVPILHGSNNDEGTGFAPKGVNTTEQFKAAVSPNNTIATIVAALYPDIPEEGIPPTLIGRPPPSQAAFGAQWKRIAAYIGDIAMHAPRRSTAQSFAKYNVTQYSYHFNVAAAKTDPVYGVTHFVEVAFVFANTRGDGYNNAISKNPFKGAPKTNFEIAKRMSRMWASFISDLDPNGVGVACASWPKYTLEKPFNYVFDANVTALSFPQRDSFRAAEIAYVLEQNLTR